MATMTGHNGMTKSMSDALSKFKSRCMDIIQPHHDDRNLLKWLKARSYDVDKAEHMFRTSMAYRTKMKVDRLMQEYQPPEVLQKYLPGGLCGFDKEGSPVLIELYGHTDMKGILYSVKKVDIEKTKLLLGERVTELLDEQSKRLEKPVEGMTVIIDMENVGAWMLWGPGIQMYAHMGKILQDNYPEIVKRSFIVNAPRIFPILWKMFRPLVTEEMKNKVCILGDDYQKELLHHIEDDQLPAFLGGTLTDSDGNPRCPSKICQGGPVPEDYYLNDQTLTENMRSATVSRGEQLQLKYDVKIPWSLLRWEFKTDGYDVGFGIYLQKSKMKEFVVAMERVNSHMVPEDGTHTCTIPGSYVVVFDNSYSWTRHKMLWYNIDVVAPTDDSLKKDLDQVTHGGCWDKIKETETTTF